MEKVDGFNAVVHEQTGQVSDTKLFNKGGLTKNQYIALLLKQGWLTQNILTESYNRV